MLNKRTREGGEEKGSGSNGEHTQAVQYTAEYKLKVVLESLQRDTTIEEVRTKFGVATSMIHRWRQEFQAKASHIFVDKRNPKQKAQAQGYALSIRR